MPAVLRRSATLNDQRLRCGQPQDESGSGETGDHADRKRALCCRTVFPVSSTDRVLSLRCTSGGSCQRLDTAVDSELTRNIGEELGTEPNGVPHVSMLINRLEKGLTMDRVRDASPGTETDAFLEAMEKTFASGVAAEYASGAAYAFEVSAVPELEIVLLLIERIGDECGVT